MSLDDDFWDDWTDEELESVVYVRSRSQREADDRTWIRRNDARWKREQAAAREAEKRAEQARIEQRQTAARRHRAKRAAVPHEPYMRQQVYDRDKGRCYMCDRRLAPGWHIEHVIPLARGGTDTLDNVRASCPRCNRRKGLQPPIFRRSI